MDAHVEPHELGKHGVAVLNHAGVVVRPILGRVDVAGSGAISVQVVVNCSGHDWQFGNEVHGVLIGGVPVLGLVDA